MSKILILALSLPFTGLLAAAQADPSSPPPAAHHGRAFDHVEHRIQELSERLHLSETQKQQIRPIIAAEIDYIQRANIPNGPSEESRRYIARIKQQTRAKILPILTPEQRELLRSKHEGNHK